MRIIPEPQYYPSLGEALILFSMVAELLAIGYLVKRYWERRGENIPPTYAVILWCIMVGSFAGLLVIFYMAMPRPIYIEDPFLRADTPQPVDPRMRLTLWSFGVWLIPMGYYINIFRHSFSSYAVDHIGPFSGAIEDPSEFADARRLALRGDVNGAVAKYRAYDHNKAEALFEAARLLKSEDRFDEAAAMFEEIMKGHPGNRRVWAEACYQLAKIHELGHKNDAEAKRLLRLLLQRAPETRYGELASSDLSRLQTVEDIMDDTEVVEIHAPEDPFFDDNDVRVKHAPAPRRRGRQVEPEDDHLPSADPFYTGTHLRRAAEKLAESQKANVQPAEVAKPKAVPRKPAPAAPAAAVAKPKAKAAAAPKAATAPGKPAAKKPAAAPKEAPKKPAAKKKP